MRELIDRKEAIDRFNVIRPVDPKKDEYTKGIDVGIAMCIVAVKDQPTIQSVATDTNVGDTISRQATIDAVNNAFDRETLLTGFVRSIAARAIRDMPSVQPEPKEGEWVQVSAQKYFTSASYFYRCSVCGENNPRNTKYCPNCGADMRGEKNE